MTITVLTAAAPDATAPFWPYAGVAVLCTAAFIALGVFAAWRTKPRVTRRRPPTPRQLEGTRRS